MLTLLFAASLLNEGIPFTYAGQSILMVGTDNGPVISWTSKRMRSAQECRQTARELAVGLEQANIPIQVQIYCVPAPHYA